MRKGTGGLSLRVLAAERLGGPLLRAWAATWRIAGSRPLLPGVYALWHAQLLALALGHRDQGAVVLVSRHRDGEIIARLLLRLGYGTARGSSTRGGPEALEEMIRAGREGRPLAFTPDGPRGPARRCKPGVVRAASATGLPIRPVAAACARALTLRSWDGFQLPLPGTRICFAYGDPIEVPGGVEEEEDLRGWTRRVEEALERAEREARAGLGEPPAPRTGRDGSPQELRGSAKRHG